MFASCKKENNLREPIPYAAQRELTNEVIFKDLVWDSDQATQPYHEFIAYNTIGINHPIFDGHRKIEVSVITNDSLIWKVDSWLIRPGSLISNDFFWYARATGGRLVVARASQDNDLIGTTAIIKVKY